MQVLTHTLELVSEVNLLKLMKKYAFLLVLSHIQIFANLQTCIGMIVF